MATTLSIEADFEQFTEADAESLELATEDLEGLEAESMESISLEDVNPESLMEGAEANGYKNGYTRPSPSSSVNKQLLKTFTIIVKKLVKKIMSNPKTRTKLQAATRKGPQAVARLITPSVAKVLPSYFRWMAPIYVLPVTLALFAPVCKEVGVKAEEVEEAPEFLPVIFGALGALFSAGTFGINAHKYRKQRKSQKKRK
jgi:hypothetical protein